MSQVRARAATPLRIRTTRDRPPDLLVEELAHDEGRKDEGEVRVVVSLAAEVARGLVQGGPRPARQQVRVALPCVVVWFVEGCGWEGKQATGHHRYICRAPVLPGPK